MRIRVEIQIHAHVVLRATRLGINQNAPHRKLTATGARVVMSLPKPREFGTRKLYRVAVALSEQAQILENCILAIATSSSRRSGGPSTQTRVLPTWNSSRSG